MGYFVIVPLLILAVPWLVSAQTCPTACFQGTPENAGPPVAPSFCPPAAGIVNPFYTSNCLCYFPETFDGSPWLFCYICGAADPTADFADVCGTNQVTNSCPDQQDAINDACKANGDVNDVLGKLCDDGKPSSIVAGIAGVVTFLQPELAEGAIELLTEGCAETKAGQTVSSAVGDICNVWQTGSTGSSGESSSGRNTFSSQYLVPILVTVMLFAWVLLAF
ncbi:hypothetical protein CVT26_014811 [Gymnopilus dilepis]|uniref:Extracellular membrane protein CFEM domain-containing protein n=1 Tax=Gymnopilus dilepis TaxID=231916 RepID=A0A409W9P9_9AGAR|nr:hypothetical protein CVT26_014811 [Gymnopilus dilepis]